jgi:hypothetical protein
VVPRFKRTGNYIPAVAYKDIKRIAYRDTHLLAYLFWDE